MMNKLIASTALAAIMIAVPAYAQDMNQNMDDANQPIFQTEPGTPMESVDGFFSPSEDQILASELLGQGVFSGVDENAERVGDVNDVVMGPGGRAEAVVIGVGGFLGLGEKNVAVDFSQLTWTVNANGDQVLITSITREQLEAAPGFDVASVGPQDDTQMATDPMTTDPMEPAAAEDQMAEDQMMEEPMAGGNNGGEVDSMADQDMADQDMADQNDDAMMSEDSMSEDDAMMEDDTMMEGDMGADWQPVTLSDISARDLLGAAVYGGNDEDLGEISDIILDAEGNANAFVVDVGGFLGIGEKPIAVSFEELKIMQDGNGNLSVHTPFTQEELEGQEAYDQTTYVDNPEGQTLTVR
ncbi:PRC-barrel domain-containing protein [Cucumibacter marinus]|uniref:PRC-barrel domain-containing protein n=1 Tax=Cucumibacter marinus TaxID=1121252 RepID=UPI0004282F96|nr:PRC-barrel domain-containing protein [Cucumibacter marinus]